MTAITLSAFSLDWGGFVSHCVGDELMKELKLNCTQLHERVRTNEDSRCSHNWNIPLNQFCVPVHISSYLTCCVYSTSLLSPLNNAVPQAPSVMRPWFHHLQPSWAHHVRCPLTVVKPQPHLSAILVTYLVSHTSARANCVGSLLDHSCHLYNAKQEY